MATLTLGNISTTFPDIASEIRRVPASHGGKLNNCKDNDEFKAKGCKNLWLIDARASFNLYHKQSYGDLADEMHRMIAVGEYSSISSVLHAYLAALTNLQRAVAYHLRFLFTFGTGSNKKTRCCQKKSSLEGYKQMDEGFLSEINALRKNTISLIAAVAAADAAYSDSESSEREREEADAEANVLIAKGNTAIANVGITLQGLQMEEVTRKALTGILIGAVIFVGYKLFKTLKK